MSPGHLHLELFIHSLHEITELWHRAQYRMIHIFWDVMLYQWAYMCSSLCSEGHHSPLHFRNYSSSDTLLAHPCSTTLHHDTCWNWILQMIWLTDVRSNFRMEFMYDVISVSRVKNPQFWPQWAMITAHMGSEVKMSTQGVWRFCKFKMSFIASYTQKWLTKNYLHQNTLTLPMRLHMAQ